jgi:2-keto-3-deoxy-L-rhamnonate aldolase RhmA
VLEVYGRDYGRTHEPLIVAQIESKRGLEHARQIADVAGIDVLFFGAEDMKLDLGIPINMARSESRALLDAQRETAEAALAAGKHCGYSGADAEDIKNSLTMGYRLIAGGGDVRFLRTGSRQALEAARRVLAEQMPLS